MKKIVLLLAFLFAIFPGLSFAATDNIYVIDISGEVTPGMTNYVISSFKEAHEQNVNLILLNVDTLGGRIDSAERISKEILNSKIKTVSYVNSKAESAGVLISISANSMYMAPASTIGSAEPIPNTEKTLSYWRSLLETTAEKRGREPQIVAAMADSSIEIEGVVQKDKLLNLSNQKAEELKFSDGTMDSREDIYKAMNMESTKEIITKRNLSDNIMGFISSSVISQFLLSLGFVGLVVEIITPGFGFGGFISILGFSLFFAGSIVSGSTTTFAIIVFLMGVALLMIEIFIPGFGIFGIAGIAGIFGSIIMASTSAYQAIISILIALLITTIVVGLIIKYLPKRNLSKTLFLGTNLNNEGGFVSSKEEVAYIGMTAKTLTFLRPSGKVEINGQMLDAISEGRYIEKDKNVVVLSVEGSRLKVKEKEGE